MAIPIYKIQGTGAGFVPDNLHLNAEGGDSQITECIKVSNDDAFAMARRLAKHEGILGGISTGANSSCQRSGQLLPAAGKTIVTIGCSTGERYLSTPLADEARRSWWQPEIEIKFRAARPRDGGSILLLRKP